MNVRHLAELAGTLSVHALQIVESPFPNPIETFHSLLGITEKRSVAWSSRMHALNSGSHGWNSLYHQTEDARCPLIEEILVSEILSRVVAGLLTGQAQQRGDNALFRMASLLFHDAQKSRRLALQEMLEMADAQSPVVRKLDRLRRLAERWTDIFLGPLLCRFAVKHLVFDADRSKEFGQAMLPHLATPAGSGLFTAGLRVAFPSTLQGVPSHAGLHRELAASVLRWLPSELFENDGGFLPLRTARAFRQEPLRETLPPTSTPSPQSHRPLISSKTPHLQLSFHQIRRQQQKP